MTLSLRPVLLLAAAIGLGISSTEGRAQSSAQWWSPVHTQPAYEASMHGPADRQKRSPLHRSSQRRASSPRGLHVPRGHRPPPGRCRLWNPNRPPGHQPPPIACRTAYRTARPPMIVVTHRGPVDPRPDPRWRRHSGRDVIVRRRPPREDGVHIRVEILIDLLGRRGVQRLEQHRRRLNVNGTLVGRWVSTDRSGGGVLQVRAGNHPLAELVDRTGDGHAEVVYLREHR